MKHSRNIKPDLRDQIGIWIWFVLLCLLLFFKQNSNQQEQQSISATNETGKADTSKP